MTQSPLTPVIFGASRDPHGRSPRTVGGVTRRTIRDPFVTTPGAGGRVARPSPFLSHDKAGPMRMAPSVLETIGEGKE